MNMMDTNQDHANIIPLQYKDGSTGKLFALSGLSIEGLYTDYLPVLGLNWEPIDEVIPI